MESQAVALKAGVQALACLGCREGGTEGGWVTLKRAGCSLMETQLR